MIDDHSIQISEHRTISAADCDLVLDSCRNLFIQDLRGENILLTGATGFFGKWLTQILLAANDRFALRNKLTILTRSRENAVASSPWLARRADLCFIESDIREWRVESSNSVYTTVIHGAATASQTLNRSEPQEMYETIVNGTKNALLAGRESKRFLFVSSGAVYGTQGSIKKIGENEALRSGHPSAYAEAKRDAEQICRSAQLKSLTIARCFAFLGPYVPLKSHFAAGNFTAQALKCEPIRVGGDGTPLRSYMYPTDLVTWLFTILMKGETNSVYNVGSDHCVSISELAQIFATNNVSEPPLKIEIAQTPDLSKPPERYVPSTEKARRELGLEIKIPLEEAIQRTLAWYRA